MQKKLIALAIASAFSAPAFAEVSMYGIVDAAVARISQGNGSAGAGADKTDTLAFSGGLSGSRLGVKSAEDLDNGMKAVVQLEYNLDTQLNDTLPTARQEMVALAGGFGTFATGYLQTAGYDFGVKYGPFAGSRVSPIQNMTKGYAGFLIGSNATASRAPRALAYISPSLAGVTVAVNYSSAFTPATGNLTVNQNAANAKTSATMLSVNYENGPLSVGGVYAATSGTNATYGVSFTDMAVGASYDLGVVKLMGTYQTAKNSGVGAVSSKALSFNAVAPVGPGAIAAGYAQADLGVANVKGSAMTVAYLMDMSKTVTLYGAYSTVSNGSGTAAFSVSNGDVAAGATNGASSDMIAVGLRKKF